MAINWSHDTVASSLQKGWEDLAANCSGGGSHSPIIIIPPKAFTALIYTGRDTMLFGPSPECVIPGRTLFGGEGEEEEDILTEPPPEQLPSKFLLDHVRELATVSCDQLIAI
ncbi:hypothetical protein BC629DRAFT_1725025 [Irpex lacteus]|nr:hypothetical protein BC629DRAFT_1725025 [Irpex lacteus]